MKTKKVLTGDLIVSKNMQVDYEEITGFLRIESGVKFKASKLKMVGGDLYIDSQATLPKLETVGGDLYIDSTNGLSGVNMRTLNDASPCVLRLIEVLGVKVLSYSELKEGVSKMTGFKMTRRLLNAHGFYDTSLDAIAFNENKELFKLDHVLLHELIHWTGSSKRLARTALLPFCVLGRLEVMEGNEYATEEVIAEMGMYKLGLWLGLNRKELKRKRDVYIDSYGIHNPNYEKACIDSDNAVGYIQGVCEISRAA